MKNKKSLRRFYGLTFKIYSEDSCVLKFFPFFFLINTSIGFSTGFNEKQDLCDKNLENITIPPVQIKRTCF